MCSGCFGEYEEFDDEFGAERDDGATAALRGERSDLGIVRHGDGETGSCDAAAGDDWSRFDVFVGTDYIVELRIVRDATHNRVQGESPVDEKVKRSGDASAKYYRTPELDRERARSVLLQPAKLLIGIALVFALCGAVAAWLALS
jgi:hypothetical protein